MRAIKIDSKNSTIIEIEIKGYEEVRDAVDGCICLAFDYPNNKHSCYVNDEGLLNNPEFFFVSKFGAQPFAGNGVIMGSTPSGNFRTCKLNLDDVKNSIKFLTLDQIQHLIRIGAIDYSTYIYTSEGKNKIYSVNLGAFNKKET